jgi:hypothetical protein
MQVRLQLIASRFKALSPLLTSQISEPPRAVLARRIRVLKVVVTSRYDLSQSSEDTDVWVTKS